MHANKMAVNGLGAEWPTASRPAMAAGVLDSFSGWQWEELAAQIGQEGQGRVALVGLAGAGKSLLFNRLRGWVLSPSLARLGEQTEPYLEWFGAFVLADLPEELDMAAGELLSGLGDVALVVYLLDGAIGVRRADYRWISLFRARGLPLVVVLNKCDLPGDRDEVRAQAEHRLGMPVMPISAYTGENVEERLLPAMLDAAPRLAVALGREIEALRRHAARRVIRQAALFAGMMSAQPLPLLDLPMQAMLQAGLVMRVGAAYGRAPAGGISREMVGAVAGALGTHYLAQTVVKFIPVIGSVVSGLLGAAATLLIGEAAIRYQEAGARVPLPAWLHRQRLRSRWFWPDQWLSKKGAKGGA